MRSNWKPQLLLVAFVVGVVFLVVGSGHRANVRLMQQQTSRQQSEEVDVNKFPIVDYLNEKQRQEVQEGLKAKSEKYNSSYAPAISEWSDKIYSYIDWDRGLPALPAERSATIIIGSITDAQAHLSADSTKIYSEFSVQVEEVLKKHKSITIEASRKISVERLGGRVRMPSGKVVVAAVSNQDMPRVGGRYVLFLTHDSPVGGRYDESLFILTAYELKNGQVFPLDKLVGHPIMAYKGQAVGTFLKDLSFAIAESLSSNK